MNISSNTNMSSNPNTSGNRNMGDSSMSMSRNSSMRGNTNMHGNTSMHSSTPSRPALAAQAANSPASSSTIVEFACLYTHDLRRKQKRWQDGRLKYHTYNQRVMVYDERGHFVGDMHWRADYDLVEGEELQLERGGVLVQVSECVGNQRQDLSELVDKRVLEREQRQADAATRRNLALPVHPPLSVTRVQPSASKLSLVPRHPPLHTVIGTPTGHHGRAVVPKESPFEQRTQANDAQDEQAVSRPAKRGRYDGSPPSKMGYAQSLFGTQLTLSATPMSLPPARPSAPAHPLPRPSTRPSATALPPERPSSRPSALALPPARPSAPDLPPERPPARPSVPALPPARPPARPSAPALPRPAAIGDDIGFRNRPEDEPRTTLRIRPGRKRGLLIAAERRVTESSTKIGGRRQEPHASEQLSASGQPHSKPHNIDGGLDDDNNDDMNHDDDGDDKDDGNDPENDDVNPFLSSPEQVPRQRPGDSASSHGRGQASRQESPVLSPCGLVSPISANLMSCMRQGSKRRQSIGEPLSSLGSSPDDQEKLPPGPRETRASSISSISSIENRSSCGELRDARKRRAATSAAKQPPSPAGEGDAEKDLASSSPVLLLRRRTRDRRQERRRTDVISESEDESIAQGSKETAQEAEASVAKKPASRNRSQAPAVPRLAKLGRKSVRSREVIGFIPSSSPNPPPMVPSHTRTRPAAVDKFEEAEKIEELEKVDQVDARQQVAQQPWMSQHASATSSGQQNNRIDVAVREAVEEPNRNMYLPRPGAVAAFPSAPQARQPSSPPGNHEQTAFSVSTIFPQGNSLVAQARPGNEKRYDSAQNGTTLLDARNAGPAQPQAPGPARPLTGVPRQPVLEQSVLATATLHQSEESNPGRFLPSLPSLPSSSRNPPQSLAHHDLAALLPPGAQGGQSGVIPDAAAQMKSSIAKPSLAAAATADAPPAVADSPIAVGASATTTATTSEPAGKLPPPRLANPATRGRKAALKSDAAGQAPRSILPSDQFFRPPAPRTRSPPSRLARHSDTNEAARPRITMKFPGFQPAGGGVGPWSKEAHDLLETNRPG